MPRKQEDRIVAIETSGRRGSVALALGPALVAESGFSTEREHAGELLTTLDGLSRDAGWRSDTIDQCHVSIGPGSFTGLRVAVTFARHLAMATGARVCAVPTLDVIAENVAAAGGPLPRLAVILDAKRGQVFAATYEAAAGAYTRTVAPQLVASQRFFAELPQPAAVIGEGIDYHREVIDASGVEVLDRSLWWPRAAHVHRLGWRLAMEGKFTAARQLVPFYIRRPEAEERWLERQEPRPPT